MCARRLVSAVMGNSASPECNHPSPAETLYPHALQSIFKFCTLRELNALVTANRVWSSAVASTPTVCAHLRVTSADHVSRVAASRLSHQVTRVSHRSPSLPALRLLCDRMPWIQEYTFCWLPERRPCDAESLALARLQHIKTLTLDLQSDGVSRIDSTSFQHAAAANHLVRAASCMQQLEHLTLQLACHDDEIVLAPLTALTGLRTFEMYACSQAPAWRPSLEQVAALRSMAGLEYFQHNFSDRNGTLRMMLQDSAPALRLKSALVAAATANHIPALQLLPDLIELDVQLNCAEVAFLASLPLLSALKLRPPSSSFRSSTFKLSTAQLTQIFQTVQRCTQIASLRIESLAVTSEHMHELLPNLPRLATLWLGRVSALTSLSFLATEALATSLAQVALLMCVKVPSSDIVHLLGLRSLRSLSVSGLDAPLTLSQKAQLRAAHLLVNLSL